MKTTTRQFIFNVTLAGLVSASGPALAMGNRPQSTTGDPATTSPAYQPPASSPAGNPGSPTPASASRNTTPSPVYTTNGTEGSSGGIQSPGKTNPASTSGTGTSGTSTSGTAH